METRATPDSTPGRPQAPPEIPAILDRLVRELIDDDESCRLRVTPSGTLLLLEIVPDGPRAAAHVIGKQGRTVAALRTIATAVCAKHGWRAQLEIVA